MLAPFHVPTLPRRASCFSFDKMWMSHETASRVTLSSAQETNCVTETHLHRSQGCNGRKKKPELRTLDLQSWVLLVQLQTLNCLSVLPLPTSSQGLHSCVNSHCHFVTHLLFTIAICPEGKMYSGLESEFIML